MPWSTGAAPGVRYRRVRHLHVVFKSEHAVRVQGLAHGAVLTKRATAKSRAPMVVEVQAFEACSGS